MRYLQSFNESKSIIGSKPTRDKKPKYDLESIFFDMIIDDIKGHYGNNFEDLTEDMNFQRKMFLTFGLNRRKLKRFQREVPLGIMRNKNEIKKVINDFNQK
jgi:hypothetical protein